MDARTPQPGDVTDRNLALELVRVTEAAALAASRWIGLGKKNEADGAAVEAMRKAFDQVAIEGTVVIGEGEMDEAPMLYIGEKVGAGGPRMDIAVDPLEGTTLTSMAAQARLPSWRWPSMATSCMRPISTWTRSLLAAACPMAWWTSTRRWARICVSSPARRTARFPTSWPASSIATATRS